MTQKIRKADLLINDIIEAKNGLRNAQSNYGMHIGELAFITKSELAPTLKNLNSENIELIRKQSQDTFEKLENTLYDLQKTQSDIDDILLNIDGWDINESPHTKIAEIINEQDKELNNMRKDLKILKQEMNEAYEDEDSENAAKDVLGILDDYLVNFSRLQDFVHESIPQIEKLFDEVDKSFAISKKYSNIQAL